MNFPAATSPVKTERLPVSALVRELLSRALAVIFRSRLHGQWRWLLGILRGHPEGTDDFQARPHGSNPSAVPRPDLIRDQVGPCPDCSAESGVATEFHSPTLSSENESAVLLGGDSRARAVTPRRKCVDESVDAEDQ